MKRTALLILSLVILLTPAWAAPKAAEVPAELDVGAILEIPGFAVGAFAQYLSLPWSINIGAGMKNYLGWGVLVGLMYSIDAEGIVIPIQGVFVGRFGFVEDMPIDMTARLGVWIIPGGTAFVGGMDFAAIFGGNFRASLGINFFPYGSNIGLSFLAMGSYVIPM